MSDQEIHNGVWKVANEKSRPLIMIALAINTIVGLYLLGAVLRTVESYFGIIWGIIAAGIIGGIFLLTGAKIARYLRKKNSGLD